MGLLDRAKTLGRRALGALDPGAPRWLTVPAIVACLVLALWQLRSLSVPLVGEHNWRQADTYSVAYNFLHESADFFHPRIDWTHGRSGVMGMEAPIFSYVIFIGMAVFGDDPAVGRWVAWILFAIGLYFFARYLRPEGRKTVAVGLLIMTFFSPMALFEFRQVQPDAAMVAFMVAAAASFHQYGRTERRGWLVSGLVLYSLAVLTKSPALVAGPAMWLFMLTARPVSRRTVLVRAAWMLVPIAAWAAWNAWAKHLNHAYNDDQVYFAIEFKLEEMLHDLTNGAQLRHIFAFLLPTYLCNWVLFPAVMAGLVLGFEKDNRPIALPMFVWFLGAALFLALFSSRLGSHWYYALVMLPPVLYFGALAIGRLLQLVVAPSDALAPPSLAEPDLPPQSRWVAAFLVPALALAPLVGGRLRELAEAPAAMGPVPAASWSGEGGLLALAILEALAVIAVFVSFRGARATALRWIYPIALLAAGILGLARAHHDAREVFRWRTRQLEWGEIQPRIDRIRDVVDRFSTRADLFVVDVPNPWFLYLPLRKGWAEPIDSVERNSLEHYTQRGARFFIHFPDAGRRPRALRSREVLASVDGWELFCLDANGCPPRSPSP